MNVAQICRQALFDVDAVRQDGTTNPFYVEGELLAWAQDGWDLLAAAVRRDHQDFGLKFMASTDASFRFQGEAYAPSSFQIVSTARNYTLPPDLIEVRKIRVTTSGKEETYRFEHLDISHPYFQIIDRIPTGQLGSRLVIYWDQTGLRNLRIANPPSDTLDLELAYIARQPRFVLYTTGTTTVTKDANTLTGTSTTWVQDEIDTRAGDVELIQASGAVAPKIVSQTSTDPFVSVTSVYPRVATLTSDTAGTLAGNWLTTTVTTKNYMIASVPQLPEEHLRTITAYVAYRAAGKAKDYARAGDQKERFKELLLSAVADLSQRQTADADYVEDYVPGGWG